MNGLNLQLHALSLRGSRGHNTQVIPSFISDLTLTFHCHIATCHNDLFSMVHVSAPSSHQSTSPYAIIRCGYRLTCPQLHSGGSVVLGTATTRISYLSYNLSHSFFLSLESDIPSSGLATGQDAQPWKPPIPYLKTKPHIPITIYTVR
ncbi:hypothetical protein L6164_021817 [Bauhinia variegata]|uniref:Uncharacterized protein n=1 Tax=Bauhinia variegata TaxID=167791 RepID=A0ACB9MG36_BAUVA|nr:hypothetical protein L6164_021817 [Bauhinia variegata]